MSGLASKVVPNSFHKLWQVQVPKFDFLSLSQVRVHEKQLPPQSFSHKKRKTPCSPDILPIFSHILVTTMIYSSVLALVCAISMVSSTSTQQEVRAKVEETQWKVGDCILGKNNFSHFWFSNFVIFLLLWFDGKWLIMQLTNLLVIFGMKLPFQILDKLWRDFKLIYKRQMNYHILLYHNDSDESNTRGLKTILSISYMLLQTLLDLKSIKDNKENLTI